MQDTIYVISPVNRIEDISNLLKNFCCSNYDRKKLIICENGKCIGQVPRSLNINYEIVQSEENTGLARNACLNAVPTGSWVAHFDSDDYYGPNYINEAIPFLEEGKLISRNEYLVKTKTLGEFQFGADHPHGATLFAKKTDYRFPAIRVGEDWDLFRHYKDNWLFVPFSNSYKYIRKNYGRGNTFNATDYELKDRAETYYEYKDRYPIIWR